MDTILPKQPKSLKRKLKLPKWLRLTIIIILIAALGLGGYFTYSFFFSKKTDTKLNTAKVGYGDVSVTISGSGAIEPIDQYDVTSLVKGEILEAPFEEGEQVNKGDLLYKIDTKDMENSIQKAEAALEKAQISYDQAQKSKDELNTASPISGVVTALYANVGDNISSNGKIMDVVDNSVMDLDVPFVSSDATGIRTGQNADVTLDGSFYTLSGTVVHVSTGTIVNSENVQITTVSIRVNNPGAIKTGDQATAIIGSVACNASGTFSYGDERTILSKGSGEVTYQPYKVGDLVRKGDKVLAVDNDSVDNSLRQSALSLRDSQLSLQNYRDQLDNYSITSPIAGKVIQKTSKAGDNMDTSTSTKTVMAIVADLSKIVFSISVDELDISKISIGQKVNITSDALTNKNFTGTVETISVVGTTSNGVTTYPVKVSIDNPEGLIPGMNVNANIVVESRSNVLRVPVSAVKRGNVVTVKIDNTKQQGVDPTSLMKNRQQEATGVPESGSSGNQANPQRQRPNGGSEGPQSTTNPQAAAAPQGGGNAGGNAASGERTKAMTIDQTGVPDGYKNVMVTIGLNDKSYIEVTGGLNEGDIVVIPTTTSTTNNTVMPGGMGGMGGFGGGMPGGTGGTTTRNSTSKSSSSGSGGGSR